MEVPEIMFVMKDYLHGTINELQDHIITPLEALIRLETLYSLVEGFYIIKSITRTEYDEFNKMIEPYAILISLKHLE